MSAVLSSPKTDYSIQNSSQTIPWIYQLLGTGLIPEWVIRLGIRRFLGQKLKEEQAADIEAQQAKLMAFIAELKQLPIAIETQTANQQHYEVPTEFYEWALGPRKKYSAALWGPNIKTLAQAEESMLTLYCQRANIEDGQRILDLGCGWGSVSLWLAEHYPNAQITGFSNSRTQKEYIDGVAQRKGFTNLQVITGNVVDYEFEPQTFQRIISIEMMEHMKNYDALLAKLGRWLTSEGQLFVHIFTHKTFAYHYEDSDGSDWLTRHFFTGGTMPSADLLHYFQRDLKLDAQWNVNGTHYQKTAEAWVSNMKQHRDKLMPILAKTYGADNATKWWVYWLVFFLSCSELWGYDAGQQWLVSHYRFIKA